MRWRLLSGELALRRSSELRSKITRGAAVSRLGRAFGSVDTPIYHLEVRQAPIMQERRPRHVTAFSPHPKQRYAMVNFGALP